METPDFKDEPTQHNGAEPESASSVVRDKKSLIRDIKLAQLRRHSAMFIDTLDSQADFDRGYPCTSEEGAILWAIAEAAATGKPIPEGPATAFLQKLFKVVHKEAESWDEVFGKPHPPRTNFAAARKWRKLADPVFFEIMRLRSENVPIDRAFELAGKKYLISASTARDYYYKYKRLLARSFTK